MAGGHRNDSGGLCGVRQSADGQSHRLYVTECISEFPGGGRTATNRSGDFHCVGNYESDRGFPVHLCISAGRFWSGSGDGAGGMCRGYCATDLFLQKENRKFTALPGADEIASHRKSVF